MKNKRLNWEVRESPMENDIRYKTVQYTSHSIIRQIDDRRLILYPDFKDTKRWSIRRKSQFIESVILGMPTHPIWCEETGNGDYLVIDGSARLLAIYEFMHHQFRLTQLRVRREFNNSYFHELPYHEIMNIEDRFQLTFLIINYDTSPKLKSEFYWQLLESEKLYKSQSARNFAYRGAHDILHQIRKNTSFLVNFTAPRFSSTNKGHQQSKIDEIYLYLSLFVNAPNIDRLRFEGDTVENLLDQQMQQLEYRNNDQYHLVRTIENILMSMFEHFDKPVPIITAFSTTNEYKMLSLDVFYLEFIRFAHPSRVRNFRDLPNFTRKIHPTANADKFIALVAGTGND